MTYSDSQFANLVIKSKLVSKHKVEECLRAAQEMAAEGDPVSLKELLMQYGYLSPGRAAWIEQSVEDGKTKNKKFGDYELVAHLGTGGMANVYLANKGDIENLVALKILHPEISNKQEVIERLGRERRALFMLEHPNIVHGLEFGNIDGQFYLEMEYVDGITLKAYAKKDRAIEEAKALDWIAQVAGALEYAHEKGFIHRDIKPRNLVLRGDGIVKILDFGLSKFADDNQELTQEGQLLGTVLYAAPEQLRGAKDVDSRADMYSLGVTLYYLLAGQVPFQGETTTATAAMIFELPFPDVREKRPDVSSGVQKLIERMTRKNPDERYQTPSELMSDIQLLRETGKISSREPGLSRAESKPNVALRLIGSAAAGLGLAGLIVFAAFELMKPDAPTDDSYSVLPLTTSIETTSAPTTSITTTIPVPTGPAPSQVLQKKVEALLAAREFQAALQDIRAARGAQIPPSFSDELKSRVQTAAQEFLDHKKEEWRSELAKGQTADVFVEIARQKTTLPDELHEQLSAFRNELLKPEKSIGEPPVPEQPPKEKEPEPTTVPRVSATSEIVKVAPPVPDRTKDDAADEKKKEREIEAEKLMRTAVLQSNEKNWPAAIQSLQKLQKFADTKIVKENKDSIAELVVRAASEAVEAKAFFKGNVESLEGNRIKISYDFSDPVQMEDWIVTSGQWRTGPRGLTRLEGDRREVLWWRHPHSRELLLNYEARALSYLSCVVAGNGLFADEGSGYVCGLGHAAGNKAAIRTDVRSDLESIAFQVNERTSYPIEVEIDKKGQLSLRSGRLKLTQSVKRNWPSTAIGGHLRLGLFGWGRHETHYSKVRIDTELSDGWLDLERARLRALLRRQNKLKQTDHALSIDGRGSYAVISQPAESLFAPPFTVELRCKPIIGDASGTLLSVGVDEERLILGARADKGSISLSLRLGTFKQGKEFEVSPGWHHVAVSFDGENVVVHLDGVRTTLQATVRNFEQRTGPIILGGGKHKSYAGLVDDVRISKVARYENTFVPEPATPKDDNTTLFLDFNEGAGNTAFDSVGKNHCFLFGTTFEKKDEK